MREAYVEPEFNEAQRGAISVCRGKFFLGGFALRTQYVSFEKGKVAAINMLNQPPFFETFAASIRHFDVDENRSEVVYKVNFTAKPAWLRSILYPIMRFVLERETQKRLKALKKIFKTQANLRKKLLA